MPILEYPGHSLRVVARATDSVIALDLTAPDGRSLGRVTFERGQLAAWQEAWLAGGGERGLNEFSAALWVPLGGVPVRSIFPEVSFDPARERPWALIDVELRAAGLAALPWEDLRDEAGRPLNGAGLLVRRFYPAFPRIAPASLDMPMHWASVGAGGLTMPGFVEGLFAGYGYTLEDVSPAVEVAHYASLDELASADKERRSDVLHLGPEPCDGLRAWSPVQLFQILERRYVRLLLLDPPAGDRPLLATLLELAGGVADLGGPGVVITRGGDPDQFYPRFYDALIHDYPVELAALHAAMGIYPHQFLWPTDPPPANGDVSLPALFFGSGRGGLTRPSGARPLAHGMQDRLQEKAGRIHRFMESIAASPYALTEGEEAFGGNLQRLEAILAELSTIAPVDDFSGERRGLLPLGHQLEQFRRFDAELVEMDLEPEAQAKGAGGGRFVNLAFLRGRSPASAEVLESGQALRLDECVHLRLDVGPRSAESIVINPSPFPDSAVDWTAPDVVRVGGIWLDVVVFTQDFEVLATDLQPLWLPVRGSGGRIYLPLVPRRAGHAELRLGLYYRDNLFQSLLVEAYVEGPDEPVALPAGWGHRARIEYSAVATLSGIEAVPERAATIITNRDENGRFRVQVKSGDLRDDLGLDRVPGFVRDIRGALDRACTLRLGDDPLSYLYAAPPPAGVGGTNTRNWGTEGQLVKALKELARLGWDLYTALFNQQTQTALMGQLAGEGAPVHIARVVQGKVIPWAVIYDRRYDYSNPSTVCLTALREDVAGAAACRRRADCPLDADTAHGVVCPWHFWGFRRAVEQPPQQVADAHDGDLAGQAREARRRVRGGAWLTAVNVNLGLVDEHVAELTALAQGEGVGLGRLDDRATVLQRLEVDDPGVIYFYCHGLDDPPRLSIGQDEPLNPSDLNLFDTRWNNAPLVFVNGCHTLAFSPESLSPFISRFVEDHGAAGVIGTEISVWEELAGEVAHEFFTRLLQGENAGQAMLHTRRRLLRKRNPLGLVYTLFCDADLEYGTVD
jgi:hypothetical protein